MKLIILLFFVVFTLQIQGQWSTDPNVNNPICTASGDQFLPQIVSDQSGGAIITWEDFRNGNNYDVYAQRISSTGVVLWSLNGVVIAAVTKDQTMPEIISDGTGGAIITWTDFRSGNYSDIYAQKINANGTIQWTANGVSICGAVNNQNNPTIVSDGFGGAIITWQDARDGSFNIYAQRINSNGICLWTTDGVPICSEINKQENPTIASDGSGGAIITWQDYRSNTDYDIYAQRINANGEVQWTANGLSLSSITGNQVYPSIINNKTNEVIITWFDVRNGIDPDIYAQRLSNNATVLWTNNGVALCTATNLQQFSVLVDDGSGGAIVTWQDYRSGAYDVYAQRIDVDGNVLWITDGVPISAVTDAQMSPAITSDGQGGAIITWRDYRDNGNQDIYAQRIDNNGIVQWTENGIPISIATTDQYTPSLTSDGSGGAIITWWDYRNSSTSDLYAQQVSHNGQLGVVTDVNEENISPLALNLEQNYPNPFNPSTKIRYQIPLSPPLLKGEGAAGGFVTLKVYDILGNEVETLVNEYKPAGRYEVEFNRDNLVSGIYLCRMQAGNYISIKKMMLLK
jgi:predicted lipoprotein with Yx(FWY)xxD motif